MQKEIQKLIDKVKKCARDVYNELGEGWPECVYQKAMEVALRESKITYETQRILPISFKGHIVGESKPDLVVWLNRPNKKRLAIVIDLKWEPYFKQDHQTQILKYIQELKKQVKKNEEVFDMGFVINFVKEKRNQKLESDKEKEIVKEKVKILEVQIWNEK